MKIFRKPKTVAVAIVAEEDPAEVAAQMFAWQAKYEEQTADFRAAWNDPDAVS